MCRLSITSRSHHTYVSLVRRGVRSQAALGVTITYYGKIQFITTASFRFLQPPADSAMFANRSSTTILILPVVVIFCFVLECSAFQKLFSTTTTTTTTTNNKHKLYGLLRRREHNIISSQKDNNADNNNTNNNNHNHNNNNDNSEYHNNVINSSTNKSVLTRRNLVKSSLSLLTINACLPRESFASSDDDESRTTSITATATATAAAAAEPFTVILTVQIDGQNQNDDIKTYSEIEIEVRPDWAPLASNRFKELVQSGFYIDSRFFRVLPGYVAQFGISADPQLNKEWMFCGVDVDVDVDDKLQSNNNSNSNINSNSNNNNCHPPLIDEPRKEHNKRGTLSFASSGKNSRTTQVFINLGNNDGVPNFLDGQNFVPFARVVRGMDDTVKQLNSEYGRKEKMSGGLTGSVNQGKAAYYGAKYLDAVFPKLSIIKDAKII
jgi:peptidyl-prolyl cis-trans isomerase A (cyclophilin A)